MVITWPFDAVYLAAKSPRPPSTHTVRSGAGVFDLHTNGDAGPIEENQDCHPSALRQDNQDLAFAAPCGAVAL